MSSVGALWNHLPHKGHSEREQTYQYRCPVRTGQSQYTTREGEASPRSHNRHTVKQELVCTVWVLSASEGPPERMQPRLRGAGRGMGTKKSTPSLCAAPAPALPTPRPTDIRESAHDPGTSTIPSEWITYISHRESFHSSLTPCRSYKT